MLIAVPWYAPMMQLVRTSTQLRQTVLATNGAGKVPRYEARILSKWRYEPRLRATLRKRVVYEPRALYTLQ